jgi:ribosome-associated translation inhibitor RaiA
MSSVRYAASGIDWSESMKVSVQHKIVEPLERHLKNKDFEVTAHLAVERARTTGRQPCFSISVSLNRFDGHRGETVHAQGDEFYALLNDVSSRMRARLRKHSLGRRIFQSSLKLIAPNTSTGGAL